MSNMPVFNSYTLADPRSNEVWRVTQPTETHPGHTTELNEEGEVVEVGNRVHISQEAFDRYRDYTESLQAASANNSLLNVSGGGDPNALDEDASKALLDSLNEDL